MKDAVTACDGMEIWRGTDRRSPRERRRRVGKSFDQALRGYEGCEHFDGMGWDGTRSFNSVVEIRL